MPSSTHGDLDRPIRTDIVKSWQRSRQNGVDVARLDVARTDVDFESGFIAAGAPVLLSMTDLLAGTSTSLALADPSGVVTWRWESDSRITTLLDRSEFELGSQFAEQQAGTNGIGLAIADRRPVTVIGTEHYKQLWHDWACFAAPVANPITGQIAGLVNIACRVEDANHFLSVALRSLASGISSAIRDSATPRQHQLLDMCLRFRSATTRPVIALDAAMMLVDDKVAALHLDRARVWSAVLEAGPHARRITLPGNLTADMYRVADQSLSHGVILMLAGGPATLSSGPDLTAHDPDALPSSFAPGSRLERAEADVIRDVLHECDGNKSETAERLGISRGTLYQRLRRYHIDG
ncbi:MULTISPECIES: helix-turn-helix domain-containing protein [unclassified Gordonia (in: high G+C Gram-positive bacteria)]